MKTIINTIVPVKGFIAMAAWPVVFIRKENVKLATEKVINHEQIHLRQQVELGIIPFYIIYLAEWLYNLAKYRNGATARRNISFEVEAYAHDDDLGYLGHRKHYAQWR